MFQMHEALAISCLAETFQVSTAQNIARSLGQRKFFLRSREQKKAEKNTTLRSRQFKTVEFETDM